MAFPTTKPFKLTISELEGVGRVAIEWSHLEYKIEGALQCLLGIDTIDTGPATTTHIPFRVRLDMISSLIRAHKLTETCVSEWDTLLSEIYEQQNWRNLIIHQEWQTGAPATPKTLIHRKARKGLTQTFYKADAETILGTANDITSLRKQIEKWTSDHISHCFRLQSLR